MSARWNSADLKHKGTATARTPTNTPRRKGQPKQSLQSEEKPPPEKHACLPPPPANPGPFPIGAWELRETTTYHPAARFVLTGPASDAERLKEYLKAYPLQP